MRIKEVTKKVVKDDADYNNDVMSGHQKPIPELTPAQVKKAKALKKIKNL